MSARRLGHLSKVSIIGSRAGLGLLCYPGFKRRAGIKQTCLKLYNDESTI